MRILCSFLLVFVLAAGSLTPAAGHEVKILPVGEDLVPLITADVHMTTSHAALDFGEVGVGYPSTLELIVTNASAETQTIGLVAQGDAGTVSIPAADSRFQLQAGLSRSIDVTYAPQFVGQVLDGSLDLLSTDPRGYEQPLAVTVLGSGVEPAGELAVYYHLTSPNVVLQAIDFASVVAGGSYASGLFLLHNVGTAPIHDGQLLAPGLDAQTGCAGEVCFQRLIQSPDQWAPLVDFALSPGQRFLARAMWNPDDQGLLDSQLTIEGGIEPLQLAVVGVAAPASAATIRLIDLEHPSHPMLTDILFDEAFRESTETVRRRFLLKNLGAATTIGQMLGLGTGSSCIDDGFDNKCIYAADGSSVGSYVLEGQEEIEINVDWHYSEDEQQAGSESTAVVEFTNGEQRAEKGQPPTGQSAYLNIHTRVGAKYAGGDVGADGQVGYPDEFGGARGLLNENVFFSSLDIDDINTMNGNLVVNIPLGQTWQVGPELSYGLTLTHNSSKWQVRTAADNGIRHPIWADDQITVPFPTNVALGWNISLGGELYVHQQAFGGGVATWPNPDLATTEHHWVYVDSTGGTHGIRHGFSTDGSHIRVRGDEHSDLVEVDLPSGITQTFRRYGYNGEFCPARNQANRPYCFRLDSIEDPFGNRVTFSYPDPLSTLIRDSHGREIVVHYRAFVPDFRNFFSHEMPRKVIRAIDFPNPAPQGGVATWQLLSSDRRITRACPVERGKFGIHERRLTVPILDGLDLPEDPDAAEPSAGAYTFTHMTIDDGPGEFEDCRPDGGALLEIETPSKGRIAYDYAYVEMPIGCAIQQRAALPHFVRARGVGRRSERWPRQPDETEAREKSSQVFLYRARDRADIEYPAQCTRHNTMETHVIHSPPQVKPGPNGGESYRHEFFFHTLTKTQDYVPASGDWRHRDYGLPISKRDDYSIDSGFGDGEKLYLSSMVLGCPTNGGPLGEDELLDENPAGCDVHRKTYRSYAYKTSPETCDDRLWQGCRLLARPLRAVREHHAADWTETRYSDFDGYGRFRRAETRSNLTATGTTSEWTNYFVWENGARVHHSVSIDADMTLDNLPRSAEPWLLGLYSATESNPDGAVRRSDFRFNEQGFLECRLTVADLGASSSPRDVSVAYEDADGDGFTELESLAGGDPLVDGDPGGAGCEEAPDYVLAHEYAMGQLKRTVHLDASGGEFGPPVVDNRFDPQTGLLDRACDRTVSPALCQKLSYDPAGRVMRHDPFDASATGNPTNRGLRTLFAYKLMSDGGGSVTITQEDASQGNLLVGLSKLTFDVFGRQTLIERRVSEARSESGGAAPHWIEQRKAYHGDDRLAFVTGVFDADTWDAMSAEWRSKTRYRFPNYDIHGRLLDFYNPKDEWTGFEYFGGASRWTERQTWYLDGRTRTSTQRDHLGRVIRVVEGGEGDPDDDGRPPVREITTSYANGVETATLGLQSRRRTTDGRALTVSESMPEKTGPVTYKYDARGHAIELIDGDSTVRSAYDRAGRLLTRKDGDGRLLERHRYWPAADGGRLQESTRYNYYTPESTGGFAEEFFEGLPPGVDPATLVVEVVDTFDYDNRGHVDEKETTLWQVILDSAGNVVFRFRVATMEASWVYDGQGRIIESTYPECVDGGQCDRIERGELAPLSLRHEWDLAELTKTDASLDGGGTWWPLLRFTYHPSGGRHVVKRYRLRDPQGSDPEVQNLEGQDQHYEDIYREGDGSAQEPDLTLPRTGEIKVFRARDGHQRWETGRYGYDGRGLISRIGSRSHAYDELERLERFGNQTYQYDIYDNLLSGSDLLPMEVHAQTNRLTRVLGPQNLATYDDRGNLTHLGNVNAWYDALGKQNAWWSSDAAENPAPFHYQSLYAYSAAGERVLVIDRLPTIGVNHGGVPDPDEEHHGDFSELMMTFHDPGGEPMREFRVTDEWDGASSRANAPGVRSYLGRDVVIFEGSDGADVHPHTVRHLTSDHLGSVRFARDFAPTGAAEETRTDFSAYGHKLGDGSTWIEESFGFAGHVTDRNAGGFEIPRDGRGFTTFMKARSYVPEVGRFLSVDPARDSAAWSLYAYAGNNPLTHVDPEGLAAEATETEEDGTQGASTLSEQEREEVERWLRKMQLLARQGVNVRSLTAPEAVSSLTEGATIDNMDNFRARKLRHSAGTPHQLSSVRDGAGAAGMLAGAMASNLVMHAVGLTGAAVTQISSTPAIGRGLNHIARYTQATQWGIYNPILYLRSALGVPPHLLPGGGYALGETLFVGAGTAGGTVGTVAVADQLIDLAEENLSP